MPENDTNTDVAVLNNEISHIKKEVDSLSSQITTGFKSVNDKLDDQFVTKTEFLPVKNIAFGMLGIIGIAVLTAVVGTVIVRAFF